MNEIFPNLPLNLIATLNEFYTAPQPDPTFAEHLEEQLREQYIELVPSRQKSRSLSLYTRRSFMHTLRSRPIMTVIAVILAFFFLTGMAYAVTWLAGFIPGIGFVKDVQSVLETPVVVERQVTHTPTSEPKNDVNPPNNPIPVITQNRDGITITIEQAVSEADRLVIAYKITGLPTDLFEPERSQTLSAEQEEEPLPEQVRLPDGTDLKFVGGGGCEGAGDLTSSWLSCRVIFSPLPEGINEFTFEIHRLQNAFPNELPEDWQIPIHLTPVSSNGTSGVQEPDLRSQPTNGITLRLLKTSQDPAQTAFQLGMEWEEQNRMVHHTAPITLQDNQGRYYILSGGPDSGKYSSENPNFSTLSSLVTVPLNGSSPMTFRLDWVIMSAAGQTSLQFNPGKDAKPDQEWVLDEKINVGGFDLHFTKARLKKDADGWITFEFDIEAPDGVVGINLFSNSESFSDESGYDKGRGLLVSRVTLPELPVQPVTFNISEVLYKVKGPWEITWQPDRINFSVISTITPAPIRMAEPTPTLVPDAPLLSELQILLERADADNPQGPGWVHQVMEINLAESTGVLDTGDLPEQPLHSRVEAWYRLDENGYVRTTIYIRKTLDGDFLSADINNEMYHFSIPEGRGGIGEDIYLTKPSYDLNLLSTLNGYLMEGGTIRQENIVINGISCRSYEATLPYDPPQVFTGEADPVHAMIYSACIDPVNGKVIQAQNQLEYADGTSLIKGTTRFLSLTKVDILPDEVRQLLEKIIMP
jgi:hypothetical protein